MAKRGRKPKSSGKGGILPDEGSWAGFSPPDLDPAALGEFHRLILCLRRNGSLGRTDPQIVVSAARIKGLVDTAYEAVVAEGMTDVAGNGTTIPHPLLGTIGTLTMRLRGLWKDMGLTLESSKHAPPKPKARDDGWNDLLAVTG